MPKIRDYPERTALTGEEAIPASVNGQSVFIKASRLQGGGSGTGSSWGSITGNIADQTDLQYALSSKADAAHDHDEDYSQLGHAHEGTYSSASHSHLYGAHASCHATAGGDALTPGSIGAAAAGHAHEGAYSSASHEHAEATTGTAGFLPALAGTTTQFLRGDGAWSTTPAGAGGSSWGSISGSLGDQADLVGALSDKAEAAHLHEGVYSSAGHSHGYSAHASCHASGGGDAITPAAIGASPSTHVHEGLYSSAAHAHEGTYSSATHNHASTYATLGHAHEGTYSSATHGHANFSTAAGFVPGSAGGTDNFLRADGQWAAPPGGGGSTNAVTVLSRVFNAASSNSSAAVDLINYSLPARTLGTNRMLRFTAGGDILTGTTAVANNGKFEILHAGSSRWADTWTTQASPSAARQPWNMEVQIAAANSSASRYLFGRIALSSATAALVGLGDISALATMRFDGVVGSSAVFSITTGVAEAFNVRMNWVAANSSLSFAMRYGVLELV